MEGNTCNVIRVRVTVIMYDLELSQVPEDHLGVRTSAYHVLVSCYRVERPVLVLELAYNCSISSVPQLQSPVLAGRNHNL